MVSLSLTLLAVSAAPADVSTVFTLPAAIDVALEHANDMIQAQEDLLLVDVDYADALSAVLPRIDVNLGGGEFFASRRIIESRNPVPAQLPTEFPQFVYGPFVDAQTNNYSNPQFSLNVTGRQLIFDGGRWWTALARVADLRTARTAALRAVMNRVRAQVAERFYALEKARRAIVTFREQLTVDREQVARAEATLQAGRGNRADAATARRNLARDRIQMRTFEVQERQARRAFNLLLGRPAHHAVELRLAVPVERRAPSGGPADVRSFEELARLAVEHRPELRELFAQLEVTAKEIRMAAADYWPVVSLDARYARSSRRPSRIVGNPFENFTATLDLVLQWNLYEGGATQARVERARVALRKRRAEYDELHRQTLADVEDRRDELIRQHDVLTLAQGQIEAAREAVRLARGLFAAGRTTALELRDAELGLTQARLEMTNARFDIEIARADLARAVGTEEGLFETREASGSKSTPAE